MGKVYCDYCGKKISWFTRHLIPLTTTWYKVDVIKEDGSVSKTETACKSCGNMLIILQDAWLREELDFENM